MKGGRVKDGRVKGAAESGTLETGAPESGAAVVKRPGYAQGSACAPGSMEARAQAPRKPVIPRHPRESGEKAGIQEPLVEMDSRLRGNDGLRGANG